MLAQYPQCQMSKAARSHKRNRSLPESADAAARLYKYPRFMVLPVSSPPQRPPQRPPPQRTSSTPRRLLDSDETSCLLLGYCVQTERIEVKGE